MEKIKLRFEESDAPVSAAVVETSGGFLEKLSFRIFLLLIFLTPVLFVSSPALPFQFSKTVVTMLAVPVAFALWIIGRLKDGRFVFPHSGILWASGAGLLVALVSALFSGSMQSSLIGYGFEIGTVSFLLTMFLILALVPIFFSSRDRIFYAYVAFFFSFFLIAFFHLLRLVFGADLLSFGVFTDMTSNFIGKWNDLAIFFGVAAVLALITIELIRLSSVLKVLSYASLASSLVFLAVINFSLAWKVLGVFSLVLLVYIISLDRSKSENGQGNREIPFVTLGVLLVSLIFVLAGRTVGGALSEKFNVSQIEARPSWSATFDVARETLVKDPLLGAGPNQFTGKWLMYKPQGINQTVFWNTDFNFGIGFVPTMLVTTGILGALSWLVFFGVYLYAGFRSIFAMIEDRISRYLATSSFLASLFLWVFSVLYVPSPVIMTLTFLFTGLFVASLAQEKIIKTKDISIAEDPKKSFVAVLALILVLISTVTLAYVYAQKYLSYVYFQKGVLAFNQEGNLEKAEKNFTRAVNTNRTDLYYRFLAEAHLLRMNAILSQGQNVSAETVRTQFQEALGTALADGREAVNLNPLDYQNWVALGRVYEAVVPLKIEGAYENAKSAYSEALKLNPKSPALYLTLARLEAAKGDNTKAREYITQALQNKNNYTEAIFLLSQIEVQEGNIKGAIASVEAASIIAPDDPTVFFQLGILRFNTKDYKGAVSALERAVTLNPSYANAKYFLGLSYEKLGRVQDAIAQFNDLKTANPDNEEIELILKNLKAGRAPFANAAPPIDDRPEKRSKLPVEERADKATKSKEVIESEE